MIFPSTVAGIPCQIQVDEYSPAEQATLTSPPETSTIGFTILDRRGYPASWLDKKLTPGELARIYEDIDVMMQAEYHGH